MHVSSNLTTDTNLVWVGSLAVRSGRACARYHPERGSFYVSLSIILGSSPTGLAIGLCKPSILCNHRIVVSTFASQAKRASSILVGCSRVPVFTLPSYKKLLIVEFSFLRVHAARRCSGTHLPLFFLVIPGSTPTWLAIRRSKPGLYATVVQLVERRISIPNVAGSYPVSRSMPQGKTALPIRSLTKWGVQVPRNCR